MKTIKPVLVILLIFLFLQCHINQKKHLGTKKEPCFSKHQIKKIKPIKADFSPFKSSKDISLLESLELCTTDSIKIKRYEGEVCDPKKFQLFHFFLKKSKTQLLIIETNSTHFAGSGGNSIFVYKYANNAYELINNVQGFLSGTLKSKNNIDKFIFSFRDYDEGEVKISFQYIDEKFIPNQLVSINGESIQMEKCESLHNKYIVNFPW